MNRLLLLTLMLLLGSPALFAQFSLPYEFSETPDFAQYTKGYDLKTMDELEVLDERAVEYAYEKEGALYEYRYIHEIRYVNSEDAIDRSNKIYISASKEDLKAYDVRVVQANGKIIKLGKDALKEGENEDKSKVTYFAVSGAEKGSYIEYYYIIRGEAYTAGSVLTFQAKVPKARIIFKIISPQNLEFTTKSVNGFPEMRTDTSLVERNLLVADTTRIAGYYEETFANEEANKPKVYFHLGYNSFTGKRNPYNYGMASQNVFERYTQGVSKDELKALDKIMKQAKCKDGATDADKIRALENFVKKTYNFEENPNPILGKLDQVLKLGALNEEGAMKLFYQAYTQMGIETEMVLTCSRYTHRFDKDFQSFVFLNSYLLYFPKLNQYMAPFAQLYRLGIIPYGYADNNALFIRKLTIGEMSSGVGKVKFIPSLPASATQHNMDVKVNFAPGNDSLQLDIKQEFAGYYAINYQGMFDYLNKEKSKEMEEEIVKSVNENLHVQSVSSENKGGEFVMVKPYVVNSKSTSATFVEKAGPKILVKFGEFIGPQSELYQEKPRLFPVENDYNRIYSRVITFTLPEGYEIKNLNDLNMDVQPFKGKGDGAYFTSTYTLKGNQLVVNCNEVYNQLTFPLEDYEKYRSVINAAANFNKIVLVLTKKP